MNYPTCFNSQYEFDTYVEQSRLSGIEEPESNYCLDCTISYQAEMIDINRCPRPDTFFVFIMEDDTEEYESVGISV